MHVAYRDDMPEWVEICPRSCCRVIELSRPPPRIPNVQVMVTAGEVTGPAQQDV